MNTVPRKSQFTFISETTAKGYGRKGRLPKKYQRSKSIVMPYLQARAWLKALVSGEYVQTSGTLFSPSTGGFCCLGVEQFVNDDGQCSYNPKNREFAAFPEFEDINRRGVYYFNGGRKTQDPYLASAGRQASTLNDVRVPFEDIAGHIFKSMLVY